VSQGLADLSSIDMAARAVLLGGDFDGNTLLIPFYGCFHRVSAEGISDASGMSCTPAVANLLLECVLRCPVTTSEADEWIPYWLNARGGQGDKESPTVSTAPVGHWFYKECLDDQAEPQTSQLVRHRS
jgi:hypothetical protein